MAKVKFPLEMAGDKKARNMEELISHFDVEKVIEHFISGKLQKWLEDRYYEEEYEAICKLEKSDRDLADKLCKIFGVEKSCNDVQIDDIEHRMRRLNVIKQFTVDDDLIAQADRIAIDQEELDRLVGIREKKIYLLDGTYEINLDYEDVEYIGIKNVVAIIPSEKRISFEVKKIRFENIDFDEKYRKLKKETNPQTVFCCGQGSGFFYSDESGKIRIGGWRTKKNKYDEKNRTFKDVEMPYVNHTFENIKPPIIDMCLDGGDGVVSVDACGNVFYASRPYAHEVEKIEGLSNIIQVECYRSTVTFEYSFYAIDNMGKLYSWKKGKKKAVRIDDNVKYKQLAIGGAMIFGLEVNGSVHLIHKEEHFETGRGNIPSDLPPIRKLTVGDESVWALSEEGKIYAWGDKSYCKIPDDISEVIDIGKQDILFTPILEANGRVRMLAQEGYAHFDDRFRLPGAKRILDYDRMGDHLYILSEDNEVYVGKVSKKKTEWKKMKALDEEGAI